MKQKSYYQLKSRLVKDQQYTEIIKDESLSIARKNAYEILCIHTTQLIQQGLIQWYTHRYPVLQTIHDLEIFNYYNPSFKSEKMFPDGVSLYFCIWNEDTESYRSLCIFKIGILEMGDYKLILENLETEFKYFQSQDHIAQLPISTIDPYWYTGMKDRFADRPKRIIQTPIDWKYNNCIARFQLENSALFALQKFKRDRVAFLTNTKKPNIKNELFSLFNTYGGFLYIGIDYKRNYFPIKDYLLDRMLDETANIFPSMVPQMRDRISVYAIQVEGKRVVVFEVRPKMNDPMVYQEQPIITMAFRTEDEGLVLSDDEEEIDDFLYVKETNRKTSDDFIPYI